MWLKKIYFLSDRNSAMNIYSFNTQTSSIEQLTIFSDYDVKYISSDGGVIVFEDGGDLYISS